MSFARFAAPFVMMAACLTGAATFAADKRETRSTEPFTALGVSAPITVYLTQGDALSLAISGSGDIKVGTLTAGKVIAAISGSGDIVVAGKADSLEGSIAGSGDLRARDLEVADAKVSIAGSGDAAIWTRSNLSVSIVGS